MLEITFEIDPKSMAEMRAGIIDYRERVLRAVDEVGKLLAAKLEDAAKKNARWQDDTGKARAGLKGESQREQLVSSSEFAVAGQIVAVYLTHGYEPDIWYGIFLELANGQEYAVIMPTIESFFPEIESLLHGIFAG